ncbi:MAG: putative PEP-binding protein [Ktedonobacteraceae bacterium]
MYHFPARFIWKHLATPVLLGLGLDEFSMSARSIPLVKQAIRRYTVAHAREIAQHALSLGDASEVRAYLSSFSHSAMSGEK